MKLRAIWRKVALLLMMGVALSCILSGILLVPNGSIRANPTSPNLQGTSPFYTGRGGWLTLPTIFSGKVVHYSLIETIYIKQNSGPDKNIKLLGDIWERITADNQLQRYHVIFTNMVNNAFYQEIYEDSLSYLVVFNKEEASAAPNNSAVTSCIIQMPARSQSDRNKDLIPFANTLEMQKEGFSVSTQTSPVSQTSPDLPSNQYLVPPSSVPMKQYSDPSFVYTWTLTQTLSNTGEKRVHHIELDSNSRVVFEYATFTGSNGTVLSRTTFAFGPAALYSPQVVAPAAFSNVQQILARGCSR